MAFRLFVDSTTGLTIEADLGSMKEAKRQVIDRHRTKSGKLYTYNWGEYHKITFNVSFVNSSFKSTVNSWWGANTDLLWKNESDSLVNSVQIVNQRSPISKFQGPYLDLFSGKIELEGY